MKGRLSSFQRDMGHTLCYQCCSLLYTALFYRLQARYRIYARTNASLVDRSVLQYLLLLFRDPNHTQIHSIPGLVYSQPIALNSACMGMRQKMLPVGGEIVITRGAWAATGIVVVFVSRGARGRPRV